MVRFSKELNRSELKYFKIERSFLKKIIMTIPYSVTVKGISNQIKESCKDKSFINKKFTSLKNIKIYTYIYDSDVNNISINLNNSEIYKLSKKIKDTILEENENLKLLFKFYGQMSSLLIKLGIPISWQPIPNGVIVTQNY